MKELSALNKYFWKYRWRFILGIFFVILTNYFRILSPQLTGYVVNTVVSSIDVKNGQHIISSTHYHEYDFIVQLIIQKFNQIPFKSKIFYTGLILFLIAIISGVFMFLMRQTVIVMSRHIEYDQKNEIYAHYQQLDMAFYKTHSTGDLMNRISEDVSRVRMYTGPAIMYFANLAAVIGFSLYFMLQSDVKLTLVALCPLPILAITLFFVNNIINKKSERIQSQLSDLTTNAQESYSGIRVIKSFVQENAMIGFFKSNSEKYRINALELAKTEAIYFPSMALLIGLSTLITIMVGSLDVIHHVPGANIGKIAEFVMYIQMLTFPVSAIGWTASITQRAVASQKRINEFLLTEPTIKNECPIIDNSLKGDIQFNHINFTYSHTGIQAIKDLTFTISAGEKVAILGKIGAGKSTIAQLLLRMYDVQNGSITLDEIPINKFDKELIRKQISYVPQDVFLFSDTIENNIRFGKDNASLDEIVIAAKNAGIYNEIMHFPDGLNTIVGERGVTLSGGQKQRISIARAILKDSKILIFDDCLSAIDSKTEQQILENLTPYLAGKTAIFITHRISTYFKFDKILVLEEGKLAEIGSHEELLKQKGLYFEMFERQSKEQKNA